jgi:hypothetical protein
LKKKIVAQQESELKFIQEYLSIKNEQESDLKEENDLYIKMLRDTNKLMDTTIVFIRNRR